MIKKIRGGGEWGWGCEDSKKPITENCVLQLGRKTGAFQIAPLVSTPVPTIIDTVAPSMIGKNFNRKKRNERRIILTKIAITNASAVYQKGVTEIKNQRIPKALILLPPGFSGCLWH